MDQLFDIFISYSHDDVGHIASLVQRLRTEGYSLWIDEEQIGGGDPLLKVLVQGIKKSRHVIVCMSPSYLEKKWTTFESAVNQSMDPDNRYRRTIPVQIQPCKIPEEYAWLYCPDLTGDKDWEAEYRKVIKNIRLSAAETAFTAKALETKADFSPIGFRKIETVLQRGRLADPQFERKSGPIWSDFESGYHPFSQETLIRVEAALSKYRCHVVHGSSGSWREQFVRYIAWHFSKQNIRVYYTDCWNWHSNPVVNIDWKSVDHDDVLLILENAHIKAEECEEFFWQLQEHTHLTRCIISMDPIITALIPQRPYFQSELVDLPRTTIDSNAIASRLVKIYAEKVLRRSVGDRIISTFVIESSKRDFPSFFYYDETPKQVNLWVLFALLQGWDGKSFPEGLKSNRLIAEFVLDNILWPLSTTSKQAISIVFVAALCSYYGVSLPESFLINSLGFEPKDVDAVLRSGLAKKHLNELMLENPAVSELILEATNDFPEVRDDLSGRLSLDGETRSLSTTIISRLLAYGPVNYDALLLNISAFKPLRVRLGDRWFFDPNRTELSNEVQERIALIVDKENSSGRLGRALLAINRIDSAFARKLASAQSLNIIFSLIHYEKNIKDIAWLLEGLRETHPIFAQQVAHSLDIYELYHKVLHEENLGKIGSLLWSLQRTDADVTSSLVERFKDLEFARRIEQEENVNKIGWFLYCLSNTSSKIGEQILSLVTIEKLAEKINFIKSTYELAAFFWGLAHASPPVGFAFSISISPETLQVNIKEEKDIWIIGLLLRAVAICNQELANLTVQGLEESYFISLVEQEEDPRKVGMFLLGLETANSLIGGKIIQQTERALSAESATALHLYHMYSTMNPTAMAMAGRQHDRAESRIAAIHYFLGMQNREKVQHSLKSGTVDSKSDLLWQFWIYDKAYIQSLVDSVIWRIFVMEIPRADSFVAKCHLSIPLYHLNPSAFSSVISTFKKVPLNDLDASDFLKGIRLANGTDREPIQILLNNIHVDDIGVNIFLNSGDIGILHEVIRGLSPLSFKLVKDILNHANNETLTSIWTAPL